ncbi:MAG TPA: VTT domain-containing protein [Candidatus Paceibacterota bacterium]|jgi:membrane protein DedA with SNARE-associated domain|nr:VTT domain-containing protein [Candidatus Paceibacterota bacterium]
MTEILNSILNLIQTNGLEAMFLGGLIEQLLVPIPSPIISLAGGAFLVKANQTIFLIFRDVFLKVSLPYSVGATIGVSLVFLLTFYLGKAFIDKFGNYFGLTWNLIEKLKTDFQKGVKDELFIVISSSIPVVPVSLVAAFCGAFRIKPNKFYPFIFLGLIIRSSILGFIGFEMGETFMKLAQGLNKTESILTLIGIIAVAIVLGYLYFKREKWIKQNK